MSHQLIQRKSWFCEVGWFGRESFFSSRERWCGWRWWESCTNMHQFLPFLWVATVAQWHSCTVGTVGELHMHSCTEWDSCIHVHHFLFPGFHGRAPLSNPHHQWLHIFHAFTRSWFWEQKLYKLSWTFKLDLTENSQSNVQFCNILKKCGDVIIQFWETQDPEAITCQLVVNGGIRWQRREPSRSTTSSSSSSSTTSSSTSSSPWSPSSLISYQLLINALQCQDKTVEEETKITLKWQRRLNQGDALGVSYEK